MAKKNDPARTHPLTLAFLRKLGAVDVLKPPEGPFDPHGPWTHTYRLWLVQRYLSGGTLTLRREPVSDAAVRLHVTADTGRTIGPETFATRPRMCADPESAFEDITAR